YHFHPSKPQFEGVEICTHWKRHVNESIRGGFNSKKHPLYVEDAIKNAEKNFESNDDGAPCVGSTDMFKLFDRVLDLFKSKLDQGRSLAETLHLVSMVYSG
ncbi:hypothetical protein VT98_12514, partial [Candidatus Electrothrix communis]